MEMVSRMWVLLLILGLVTTTGRGSPSGPKEDLVTSLPGQPVVDFEQYAGYVTVDENKGRALFYYFVEAALDSQDTPLTLWLSGGPGSSSVALGSFSILGPFFPDGYGTGLVRNPLSWNNVSNLLFLESPVGVGWSYSNSSDDYVGLTDERTANDNLMFLLNWFEKFPTLKTRGLYLAGESYAGHYVPQLAELLLAYNKQPTRDFAFNLKGFLIGNPLIKYAVDQMAIFTFSWSHGVISDRRYEEVLATCNFTEIELTRYEPESCKFVTSSGAYVENTGIPIFDVNHVLVDLCLADVAEEKLRLNQSVTQISLGMDVCIAYERAIYFNLPEVQKALHANTTGLPYFYSARSEIVNSKYAAEDAFIDIQPVLKRILQNGLQVLIFSGDLDFRLPFIGSRQTYDMIALDLQLPTSVNYTAWYDERQVAGFTTTAGNFTFATVRGAGHMVSASQPSRGLAMFKAFVTGTPLMTLSEIP